VCIPFNVKTLNIICKKLCDVFENIILNLIQFFEIISDNETSPYCLHGSSIKTILWTEKFSGEIRIGFMIL